MLRSMGTTISMGLGFRPRPSSNPVLPNLIPTRFWGFTKSKTTNRAQHYHNES